MEAHTLVDGAASPSAHTLVYPNNGAPFVQPGSKNDPHQIRLLGELHAMYYRRKERQRSAQITKNHLTLVKPGQKGEAAIWLRETEEVFIKNLFIILDERGVDLDFPIVLNNSGGEVVCETEHPDTEEINRVFRQYSELRNMFIELTVNKSVSHVSTNAIRTGGVYPLTVNDVLTVFVYEDRETRWVTLEPQATSA